MENATVLNVADAAQGLTAISPAYMKLPIREGFNWDQAFGQVGAGMWYLVVFRSRHKQGCDSSLLSHYDERASEDARRSPGFLHYFAGTPTDDGDCLSFCIWENQQLARAGVRHEAHQKAQSLAATAYESYQLERYVLRKSSETDPLAFERL